MLGGIDAPGAYVHQLVKAASFTLTKETTAKGHVDLTLTICRNFEFHQNDTKIWRKLAYEMYSCVLLRGVGTSPPRPPDQGLCPWTALVVQPPDPHYMLALPRSP